MGRSSKHLVLYLRQISSTRSSACTIKMLLYKTMQVNKSCQAEQGFNYRTLVTIHWRMGCLNNKTPSNCIPQPSLETANTVSPEWRTSLAYLTSLIRQPSWQEPRWITRHLRNTWRRARIKKPLVPIIFSLPLHQVRYIIRGLQLGLNKVFETIWCSLKSNSVKPCQLARHPSHHWCNKIKKQRKRIRRLVELFRVAHRRPAQIMPLLMSLLLPLWLRIL